MAKGNKSGGIGARLLIIIYAAAIVAIGIYPIKQEYGSFEQFVKKELPSWLTKEKLETLRVKRPEDPGVENRTRARLRVPKLVRVEPGGKVPEEIEREDQGAE